MGGGTHLSAAVQAAHSNVRSLLPLLLLHSSSTELRRQNRLFTRTPPSIRHSNVRALNELTGTSSAHRVDVRMSNSTRSGIGAEVRTYNDGGA